MDKTIGIVLLSYDVNDKWEDINSTLIHEYRYSDLF